MSKAEDLLKELDSMAVQLNREHWVATGHDMQLDPLCFAVLLEIIKNLARRVDKLEESYIRDALAEIGLYEKP